MHVIAPPPPPPPPPLPPPQARPPRRRPRLLRLLLPLPLSALPLLNRMTSCHELPPAGRFSRGCCETEDASMLKQGCRRKSAGNGIVYYICSASLWLAGISEHKTAIVGRLHDKPSPSLTHQIWSHQIWIFRGGFPKSRICPRRFLWYPGFLFFRSWAFEFAQSPRLYRNHQTNQASECAVCMRVSTFHSLLLVAVVYLKTALPAHRRDG